MNIRILLVSLMAWGSITAASAQTQITRFNFESGVPSVFAASYAPERNAEIGIGSAGGLHASASQWSAQFGNFSLTSFRANNWVPGDYFQFTSNTQGFSDIWVTFAIGRTSVGPVSAQLYYSGDGVNFNLAGGFTVLLSPFTGPQNPFQSFDLSAIAGLNNNPNAAFRIVATAASGGGGAGELYVEDFNVTSGGPIFGNIPEPSVSLALSTAGLVGWLALRRRPRG